MLSAGKCTVLFGMCLPERKQVPSELNLPCHRVVNAQGRLAPGWEEQRLLLQEEGVCFRKNGNVDMTRCLWHYDE